MSDTKDLAGRDVTGARPTGTTEEFLDLLAEHVPLALLADLAAPSGLGSSEILRSEGLPDDAWWETGAANTAAITPAITPPSTEKPEPA